MRRLRTNAVAGARRRLRAPARHAAIRLCRARCNSSERDKVEGLGELKAGSETSESEKESGSALGRIEVVLLSCAYFVRGEVMARLSRVRAPRIPHLGYALRYGSSALGQRHEQPNQFALSLCPRLAQNAL